MKKIKKFSKPEIEIELFETKDIICASSFAPTVKTENDTAPETPEVELSF